MNFAYFFYLYDAKKNPEEYMWLKLWQFFEKIYGASEICKVVENALASPLSKDRQ